MKIAKIILILAAVTAAVGVIGITAPSQANNAPDFNVLVLGWDGVQRDHFWQCYNKELPDCPDGLPNLKKLTGDKIFDSTVTNGWTVTKPGWAQILSGYNDDVMGIYSNWIYQPLPRGYSILEKLEKNFAINTFFLAGKSNQVGGVCPGEINVKGAIEISGEPWCLAKEGMDYYENDIGDNRKVQEKALSFLRKNKRNTFFGFVQYRDPDRSGHKKGENSSQYTRRIVNQDRKLGRIMRKLKRWGIAGKTYIYVTTDHGFDEDGQRHRNAPYGFFATNDPRVMRSGDRKDLTPTLLEKYGLSLDDGVTPKIDGHSLYSIPQMSCVPEGEAYVDYPGGPKCCAGLSLISLDKVVVEEFYPATGGEGDNSGYCTNCGDGICTEPENGANCPADCEIYPE